MYNPALDQNLIRVLYRLKQFYKKPITKLANELIEKSLSTIDRESVCRLCKQNQINDCDACYFSSQKDQ